MKRKGNIIDLAMTISPDTRVFPGAPKPSIERYKSHEEQGVQVSRLTLSVHAGTHVDAPRHFLPQGISIDQVSLEKLMGEAVLADLRNLAPGSSIQVAHLAPFADKIRPGDILVMNTGYENCGDDEKYCFLSQEAATWLVGRGIKCLAGDIPSVDPIHRSGGAAGINTHPAHHVILGAGIPIVEGLVNLDSLPKGRFFFCCLPLKILGSDGAPVRAVAYEL